MVRVLEEHGPERIIVNSACDWGVSDPLKVRKTADAMKAAGFDDDVIDQVVWRNPVEFFAQSGRLILDDLGRAGPDGDVRGQRRAARREGDEAAAPRRQPAAPRLLLQRPSGRRPRRGRGAARALHGARARAARRAGARHRPVGRGAGAGRRGRGATGSPTQLERLCARGRDAERLPVQGVPRAGGQARRLLAALGAGRRARDYTLGLARLLARLLPDDVEDGLDLDAAARLARGLGRRGAGRGAARAGATSPSSSRRSSATTGKRIRLALEPEPGCTVETIAQACDALGGLAPEWIGVCLDACHLAVQFEDAGRGGRAAAAPRACPIVKTQVSRALRVPTTRAPRRAASCSRASTSRGSCTRCASA